ncbi:MAG TPA: alpha-L-rhamnosidase C-terminal domain-containing protein, partial [Terriglobia bacterium]|nr:alpha-L-rhamnosidase C-terminal domain-containing protein [Terriglobia bacterium]
YMLRPVAVSSPTHGAFQGLQSARGGECDISVNGTGAILFDFGTESAAWMEFDSSDLSGNVEMGVSEFNVPANENCIAAPERIGITCRLKLNPQYYEGVRFGWIYVRSFSGKPWRISAVRLVCQIKPTNYDGSFFCSDPMLARIWYTGAYTVKLNLLRNYFGAILMERGDRISWTGDAHIAQSASMVAFGNWGFVKKNLAATAHNDNDIASYALYWVLSLVDYYRYTGDTATLASYIENVQAKLANAEAMFDSPKIVFYGWDDRLGGFIKSPNFETSEAYRMLFIETCRQFAWAVGTSGRHELREQYLRVAHQRAAWIQARPDWSHEAGIFASSDAINAGVPAAARERLRYRRDFTNPVERISFSPFNEYFIIKAMGKMNWTDQALETVLEDWGGQIEYGGTTFFECYWPSWNAVIRKNGPIPSCIAGPTSLCHPWSAGSTTWLTEYVAGITPTSPGFTTVDITPHLGRLLTHVTADAPTPRGTIHASFDVKRGAAEVVTPPGVVARVGIPKIEREIEMIRANGQLVWDGSGHTVAGISGVRNTADFIYFTGVESGRYAFQISYRGHTPAYVRQPLRYQVKEIRQDAATRGNWGGVYGRDGYSLFGYDGNGKAKESLPNYVESVTLSGGRYVHWVTNGGDPRALAPDRSNKRQRIASAYYSRPLSWKAWKADLYPTSSPSWDWGPATMVVDIHLTHAHNYRLAMYAVDFDGKGRWESVDILRLPSLVLAAPVQAIADFREGKYLIFEFHDSVRLRINGICGPDAVVSGVFFDPAGSDPAQGAASDG